MRTAYLLTGDAHLAEDLLQSVLINVVGRWPELSADGNLETYTCKAPVKALFSRSCREVTSSSL
ncbi:hypothetical protein ACFYSC_31140 [Streptosporangium sp. NPDC004379]|uniref:hypothetical protein n=1 Tax=Streptosporangium sp. NPDC004379 TaxID=3366189 RepID=UPI0036826C17